MYFMQYFTFHKSTFK